MIDDDWRGVFDSTGEGNKGTGRSGGINEE
jgi:hypothetical protein